MKKYERTQWMYLGSHISKPSTDNSSKISERMTLPHRTGKSSYRSKFQELNPILLDQEAIVKLFHGKYRNYVALVNMGKYVTDKNTLILKLTELFNETIENSMIVYSGPAEEMTGDWKFEFKTNEGELVEGTISFEEILAVWKKRNHVQRHLLLIMDSSFGENWIIKLRNEGESTITIQSSTRQFDRATDDKKIGSYFIYNWTKILAGSKFDQVYAPVKNPQVPTFYGNFYHAEKYFGVQLKFENWNDMRKALNSSYFGDWPRLCGKDNPYIDDIEKTDQAELTRTMMSSIKVGGKNFHGKHMHGSISREMPTCKPGQINSYPLLARTFLQPMIDEQIIRKESLNKSILLKTTNLSKKDGYLPTQGDFNDFVNEEGKYLGDHNAKNTRNGYGVLLDENERVIFQGQFKNGLKHGMGVVFTAERVKVFEGVYEHHMKNGRGQVFNEDRIVIFDGWFEDDLRHGEGSEYLEDGLLLFEGSYFNDLRQDEGIEYYRNGLPQFRGTWKNGNVHGKKIICYYETGPVDYKGEYQEGIRTGYGKKYYESGDLMYQGELLEGEFHGQGTFWEIGTKLVLEGFWEHGNFVEDSDEEGDDDEDLEKLDFYEHQGTALASIPKLIQNGQIDAVEEKTMKEIKDRKFIKQEYGGLV